MYCSAEPDSSAIDDAMYEGSAIDDTIDDAKCHLHRTLI